MHCYNTFDYRETQHDLWPLEEALQGQTVFLIDRHNRKGEYETFTTSIGKGIHYRVVENFRSFRNVQVEVVELEENEFEGGEIVELEITMKNNYDYVVDFADVNGREVYLNAHILEGLSPVQTEVLEVLNISMAARRGNYPNGEGENACN